MNNRMKGALAGIAGVALLTGGSTFALWSDDASVDGGTITAGNLDVALIGTPSWQDVSSDRADSPHAIDLSTYRIVPGDTIEGRFDVDLALQGDNMLADLGLAFNEAGGSTLLAATEGVTVTYELVDGLDASVAGPTALGSTATLDLRSTDNTAAGDAGVLTVPTALDNTADYTVVVTAVFDSTTPDQVRTQATADLANLVVSLSQARS